jgi:hypothetical protein
MDLHDLLRAAAHTRTDAKADDAGDNAWGFSKKADDPKGHAKAADAHKDAALAFAKKGDMNSAEMHTKVAALHGKKAEADDADGDKDA